MGVLWEWGMHVGRTRGTLGEVCLNAHCTTTPFLELSTVAQSAKPPCPHLACFTPLSEHEGQFLAGPWCPHTVEEHHIKYKIKAEERLSSKSRECGCEIINVHEQ